MPKRKRVHEEPNQPFPQRLSSSCNSNSLDALDQPIQNNVEARVRLVPRMAHPFSFRDLPILGNVMEALADPNTHLLGVYGSDDDLKDTLLERVCRRVARDNLFDLVLTATVTIKPSVRKIQEEIAGQLRLTFNHKSRAKRAVELIERIKIEQRILIVLCDIHKKLDLGKVGIPYGAEHTGCKILLTSTAEDVLSNHMHTQRTVRL